MTHISRRARGLLGLDDSPVVVPDARAEPTASRANLASGDPSFALPAAVEQELARRVAAGPVRYSDPKGLPELRAVVAKALTELHGVEVDPECVCVTNGSKQALWNTMLLLLDPGDEVVVIEPVYPAYRRMVEGLGATPVAVGASCDEAFALPVTRVDGALSDRTRVVIVNSPNNPTGAVYSPDELSRLAAVVGRRSRAVLLADQAYERLYFEGDRAPTVLDVVDASFPTVLVGSISKTYGMTGYRVGYAVADRATADALAQVQFATTHCANVLGQHAAVAAVGSGGEVVARNVEHALRGVRMVEAALDGLAGVRVVRPRGGIYAFLDCRGLLGHAVLDGARLTSDVELARHLDRHGVTVAAGSIFGFPGGLRLTAAIEPTELARGLERVRTALAHVSEAVD